MNGTLRAVQLRRVVFFQIVPGHLKDVVPCLHARGQGPLMDDTDLLVEELDLFKENVQRLLKDAQCLLKGFWSLHRNS